MDNSVPSAIYIDRVDGVPLLWNDGPPPFSAVLNFRVGRADEQLSNSGITHLVEHLAFPHDHNQDANCNGSTGLTTTSFYAWGEPDEAAAFIRQTSVALAKLGIDRVDHQRSVILTEEVSSGGGVVADLLVERYGARGQGVVGFRQLGIHRLKGADVQGWATRYFTADNAILCINGRPPDGLSLELPRGEPIPTPLAQPIDGPLPRWVAAQGNKVALAVVTGQDPAAGIAQRVLEKRLYAKLRNGLGISYAVESVAQLVDPRTTHRVTVADSQPENSASVARYVVELAAELAEHGPTGVELRESMDDLERRLREDPRALSGWMMHAAECYLNRIELEELGDYLEARQQVTVSNVRDSWVKALQSAILAVPSWVDIDPRLLPRRQMPRAYAELRGQTFHQPGIGHLRGGPRAVVSDEALSLAVPNQGSALVSFARCAALVRHGHTTRTLVDFDGNSVSLNAADFANGRDLLAALDHRIPTDKWIDIAPG